MNVVVNKYYEDCTAPFQAVLFFKCSHRKKLLRIPYTKFIVPISTKRDKAKELQGAQEVHRYNISLHSAVLTISISSLQNSVTAILSTRQRPAKVFTEHSLQVAKNYSIYIKARNSNN